MKDLIREINKLMKAKPTDDPARFAEIPLAQKLAEMDALLAGANPEQRRAMHTALKEILNELSSMSPADQAYVAAARAKAKEIGQRWNGK